MPVQFDPLKGARLSHEGRSIVLSGMSIGKAGVKLPDEKLVAFALALDNFRCDITGPPH